MDNIMHTISGMDSRRIGRINSIMAKVAKRIRPLSKLIKEVDAVYAKINQHIASAGVDAECVKGGSIAKNTFLKGDHDVDLFVRFSLNYPDETISDMLSRLLSHAFPKVKIRRVHGSRDYFQFRIGKLDYEIVPVAKIHETALHEARNITDFSPFHVHWTESKIKERPELSDEIRIAKMFCKANNVYGAESYIKGFSGHIIDIIIIHYGSFLNLVKKFSSIKEISPKNPLIIDPERHLENPLDQLNSSKISSVIIIDPIQKDRNAAAALSDDKISVFIDACRNFLDKPSEDFFIIKKFSLKDIKVTAGYTRILIDVSVGNASKDVAGTKILKAYQFIIERLRTYGFIVENSGWHFDYAHLIALIYIIVPAAPLSEYIERPGPPVKNEAAYKNFCDVHSNQKLSIKNHRVFARVKREYVRAYDYVRKILLDEYIVSRVQRISLKK